MLSICIPVFNFSIENLFKDLYRQALELKVGFEFIIIDDCSLIDFKESNSFLINHPFTNYIELEENIGRSKIRNLFLKYSQYDYLLLMDCDSKVTSNKYLQNYIDNCTGQKVICGGTTYQKTKPDNLYFLRWLYGIKRESLPEDKRRKKPFQSFTTHNFVIAKSILEKIKFNEELEGYGHEDTLFGFDLFQQAWSLVHIDNPLMHIGLIKHYEFLSKTEEGIKNLNFIDKKLNNPAFIKSIKLLSFFKILKTFRIYKIIGFTFFIFKPLLRKNLLSKHPSLFLFDIYKVGVLCEVNK